MSPIGEHHLYVAWRRPEGLIVPVGRLTQLDAPEGTTFRFVYLKGAERHPDFPPSYEPFTGPDFQPLAPGR